ncbi:MAG: NAD-dependent protein deacylase [Planctomycetes bacterium]|nr:NAD-dependent protein deacylase [Planctomycetota bacterium]
MTDTLTPDDLRRVDQVVELLRQSKSLLFITGAGLSADSGLPTYRGTGGLYDGRDPEEGVPIETLLSAEVLERCPELTWKYLLQIERAGRSARPNRGHEVIAEMEKRFERVWVLTQNVDGLHHRAGSRNVIDIHGTLHQIRCMRCAAERAVTDYEGFALPPLCTHCGGVVRPNVVLFGERLPARQLATYRTETERGFDLVLSIGTTSVFPYISAPVLDAHHLYRPSVEINPGETDVTEFVTVKIPLGAAAALDAIWTRYNA